MPTLAQVFAEAKQPPDMAKIGPPAWAELHAWANRFATKVGASCGCGKFAQQLASFDHDLVSIYLGKHPFDEHNFVEVAQMVAETLQAWYNRKEPSVTGSSLSRAENRTQDGVPCPTKTRQSETHGRFGSTLPSDKLLASRTIPNLTELPRNSKSGLPRQSNEHNCTTVNTERSAVQNSSKQNVNGTLQTEKGLGIQQDNRLMPSEAERKPNAGINNGEMPIKTALGSATSGKELSLERKIRNVNTPVLIGQVTLNGQERSGQNARATESEQSFGMNSWPDIEANAPIAEVKSDLQQTMSSPSAKAEQPHCETLSSPASHAIRVVKQSLSQNPSNSDSDILRGIYSRGVAANRADAEQRARFWAKIIKTEAAAKEPWQMTYREATRGAVTKAQWNDAAIKHKRAVRQAIRAGKPVPPEVLADYPDLAKRVSEERMQTALFQPHQEMANIYYGTARAMKDRSLLADFSLTRQEAAQQAEMQQAAPFGWPGGKKVLKYRIIALILPHKTYVEPFAGAASVFWAKEPAEVEVLNDLDSDLMRFYQNIGELKGCDAPKVAASMSGDWQSLETKRGSLEPCEFFAAVMCSFGRMLGNTYSPRHPGCAAGQPHFHKNLAEYQARLAQTRLHNEDWEPVVRQYDAPDTFFYLDPPYHGTGRYYGKNADVLPRLANVLPALTGKWLLSYDDHPDVRAAFKDFYLLPVRAQYTLSGQENDKLKRQLLIANYPLAVSAEQRLPLCTPAQQKRLERCILALKARGSKVNPWAVCQASLECRRRRWQVPEGSGKWVYAPELRQITQASVYPWPEGMFDEDEEEDDEEEDEGMEQRENTASFHNCLSGHDWIKLQDLVGAGKKTEALELMWDKGEPHHGKIRPAKLSQSFIDTILHTAIGTGTALAVSRVLNPPAPAPPPIIKEEKPKEPPLTVINPAHVEGDQANVDLGTLLEEIDAILKKPETMGIVDAETLTIVRG